MLFTPTSESKMRVLKTCAQALFFVSSSAILNSYGDYRCKPISRPPLPAPRSPLPAPRSPLPCEERIHGLKVGYISQFNLQSVILAKKQFPLAHTIVLKLRINKKDTLREDISILAGS